MPKFRKKPIVIEALQFDGTIVSAKEICNWANSSLLSDCDRRVDFVTQDGDPINAHDVFVHTLEGVMEVSLGDWVIQGVKGEHYPCKPDIFEQTYEPETGGFGSNGDTLGSAAT